jgi:uncharacterized membrane protein YbhN (UPF0104 family)
MTVPARRAAAAATTVVGTVIAVLGFAFVIRRAAQHWTDVQYAIHHAHRGWIALAIVLAVAGMLSIAVAWRPVVHAVGGEASLRDIVRWYFPGELGKYVPGGIWPVVGRGELARRGGIRRTVAYASVALSLAGLYLAGIALVAALLPAVLVHHHGSSAPLLIVLLLPIGIVALHPRVQRWMYDRVARVTKREIPIEIPAWRTSLTIVVRYLPAWACIGSATWCMTKAFTTHGSFVQVFVATVASWVAGFVVPVPGGVGVREAAFVALAGLPGGIGPTVAIMARLMFMAVDTLGAALAPLLLRRSRTMATANAPEG